MKKLLATLVFCCIAFGIHAQTEHMKFMGITMDCSIKDFQKQLRKKGVKYNSKVSRYMNVGCRVFDGSFSGEIARIFVYYNDNTKIVYKAKTVIRCSADDVVLDKYYKLRDMLKSKYSDQVAIDIEQDGNPALSIRVVDSKIGYMKGYVAMYIYKNMDEPRLHIDYIDSVNEQNNENSNMDDL